MERSSYEIAHHPMTREVYAVRNVRGVITGVCGPLRHCEYEPEPEEEALAAWDYVPEASAWAETWINAEA
jgi:hypothetical protein